MIIIEFEFIFSITHDCVVDEAIFSEKCNFSEFSGRLYLFDCHEAITHAIIS